MTSVKLLFRQIVPMEPRFAAAAVASLEEKVLFALAFDRSHARGHFFLIPFSALSVHQKSFDHVSFHLIVGLAFLEFSDRLGAARLDQLRPELLEKRV